MDLAFGPYTQNKVSMNTQDCTLQHQQQQICLKMSDFSWKGFIIYLNIWHCKLKILLLILQNFDLIIFQFWHCYTKILTLFLHSITAKCWLYYPKILTTISQNLTYIFHFQHYHLKSTTPYLKISTLQLKVLTFSHLLLLAQYGPKNVNKAKFPFSFIF